MAEWSVKQLKDHIGHQIELVEYLGEVVVECVNCGEILLEFYDDEQGILNLGVKEED